MDRKQYNECMRPHMKGTGSKEERGMRMCIGAKLCTSKASNEEEAKQICLSRPPKEPKPAGRRTKKQAGPVAVSPVNCQEESMNLVQCIVKNVSPKPFDLESALVKAVLTCKCGGTNGNRQKTVS